MQPHAWHSYLTDIAKSAVRVGEYGKGTWESKLTLARLWAPVLRWEREQGKPWLVVLMGRSVVARLFRALVQEGLVPQPRRTEIVTHYAAIGQRPAGRLGPMDPARVKGYEAEFARVAKLVV